MPAEARSVAGIAACTRVALTKVVVRVAPFQRTVAPETRLLPLTVKVRLAAPASPEVGASELSVGTGLLVVVPPPMSTVHRSEYWLET